MIEHGVARRAGAAAAGGPGDERPLPVDLGPVCADAAERVVAYTGLAPRAPLPAPESIGRAPWREANVLAMDALLQPLADKLGSGPQRVVVGVVAGAEAGLLLGWMSRRVLGQYDLRLLDPSVPPRLLMVVPNLRATADELGVGLDPLARWVAVHEVTHAVQFGGVPWLQPTLAGLLAELVGTLEVDVDWRAALRRPGLEDAKALVELVRSGSLVEAVAGSERAAVLDRVQATMALVEGHAEHVMDVVGADVVEDLPTLRAALDRRRERVKPLPVAVLERLLGLDLKLAQYQRGKAFCDAVVDLAGPGVLHRAFAAPDLAPSLAELGDPAAWLARLRLLPA